jgi:hypothetical protein
LRRPVLRHEPSRSCAGVTPSLPHAAFGAETA